MSFSKQCYALIVIPNWLKITTVLKIMCNSKSGFKQPFNWFITKHGQKHKPKPKINLWYKQFQPINKVIWTKRKNLLIFLNLFNNGEEEKSSWTKSPHGILKSTICSGESMKMFCVVQCSPFKWKKINIYWKVQIYDEERSLSYCIWCNVRHGLTWCTEGIVKSIKDTRDRVLNKGHISEA